LHKYSYVLTDHHFFIPIPPTPISTLFPYTTLFRSTIKTKHTVEALKFMADIYQRGETDEIFGWDPAGRSRPFHRAGKCRPKTSRDRKSTRLNSSHVAISYAVFCLKKKKKKKFN